METNFSTMVENLVEIAIKMNEKYLITDGKLKEMQDKLSIMDTYKQVVDYIGVEENIDNIIRIINDVIIGVLGVSYCAVSIYDGTEEREISQYKITSEIEDIINKNNIEEVEAELLKSKGIIIIRNLKERNFLSITKGAFLSVGLLKGEIFYGSMAIYYTSADYLDNNKIEFFKLIGSQLVLHIENAKLFKKLRQASITDELSGLNNRIYMNEVLLNNASLDFNKVGIIIMDIDNFKKINDSYGHIFGDKVIVTISNILKKMKKKYNVNAFRFGGEEFLVFGEGKTPWELEEIAEDIRVSFMETEFDIKGEKIQFTISLGGTKFGYSSKIKDVGKIMEDADTALYYSKTTGKNRYTVATGNIQLYMNGKSELEKMSIKQYEKNDKLYLLKITFKDDSYSLDNYKKILSLIRSVNNTSENIFNNNLGEFMIISEVEEGLNKIKEKLTTLLCENGFEVFEFELLDYDYANVPLREFFKI